MGIEKMSLIAVDGPSKSLDSALMSCCESGVFHIASNGAVLRNLGEQNPYKGILARVRDMAINLKIPVKDADFSHVDCETAEDFENYLGDISKRYDELNEQYAEVEQTLREHLETDAYVRHLHGLDVPFSELFSMKYVKMRIGRMPLDNEEKLQYYATKCFVFQEFEKTEDYVYGIYLVPVQYVEFADELMTSLGFERTRLPDYLEGDADIADKKLHALIEAEEKKKEDLEKELAYFADSLTDDFSAVLCKLRYKSEVNELRKKVVISNGRFSFSGYCPARNSKELRTAIVKNAKNVQCTEIPVDKKHASPEVPVKLKNNVITRPFEMFTRMYGLPVYGGFDPTPYVAVTYMLMFGIMFGDVGQGLVISLLGLILTKTTKNGLAPVMTRLGIFSALFGCVYGSVFGIETIITPIFHRADIWYGVCDMMGNLGIPHHPESIFQAATAVLIFALFVGVVLILISMIFNTVKNFKAKKLGEALFDVNGVAGIVLYASLIIGLAGTLMYGLPIMSVPYVICLIILPVALIFFKTPLTALVTGKKAEKFSIAESFIGIFEGALSFLSNTMSFLRIGGFVLSHAGFMLVVSQLAGASQPNAPITVGMVVAYIIGNILVMGIEGLLSGIQVLRLEFYEVFSRFYDGGGSEFTPLKIKSHF